MTHYAKLATVLAFGAALALAGCSREVEESSAEVHHANDGHDHSHDGHDHEHGDHDHESETAMPPSPELKKVVLTAGAPAQPAGVAQSRTSATTGQDVTIEGRLKDFVKGKAAFTVVDGSINSCIEEGDGCKTPWDYCCVSPTKLAQNSATIKLVDAEGSLLNGNLQGVNNIDHLTTVVVTGKAEKDPEGNLTIAASNVYIK